MAETTDNYLEISGASFSAFSVPEQEELGWTPAEHVIIEVASGEVIGDFVFGEPVEVDTSDFIDFDLEEIQVTDIIADINATATSEADLNYLLESLAASLGSEAPAVGNPPTDHSMLSSLDEAMSNPLGAESPASLTHQSGFGLGEMTIIIDDGDSESVAI